MLEERKVGLVPRVLTSGRRGIREHAILLTDKRSIIVLEKAGSTALALTLGAAVAQATATRRQIDYMNTSPDELAADEKNTAIPHDRLLSLRGKKGFWRTAPKLFIEYTRPDGKRKKLKAFLEPPKDLMKQRKSEGAGRRRVLLEYAAKVREAYQRALPASASLKAEWQF